MIKKVNVYPVVPIYALRTPINSTTLHAELSTGDILTCIYARAKVEEILPNGQTIRLDLKNYDKNNYCEPTIEHISKIDEPSNVDESNVEINTKQEVLQQEATIEDGSLNIEIPETISPEEEIQVEENLAVEVQDKRRKNKNR